MILKNITLKNRLKKIIEKHPEVCDILIFGSVIRGKSKPNDFDVLVLFENEIDKDTEYLLRKEIEKDYSNVSIISKTKKTVLDDSFDARESVLFEGTSLIDSKGVAGNYGFSSFGLFKYNFGGWNKLKKTKFYYAINGRSGNEGIASILNAIKISDSLMIIPLNKIEDFKDFLDSWRIKYIYIPILIPNRLSRKKILQR